MSREKAKGTAAESAVVRALRDFGWRHAERRALHGTHDLGDITGLDPRVCIEVKDHARLDLAGWLDEANKEKRNAHAEVGAVWAKRRGKSSAENWYVLMDGEQFMHLLNAAGYGELG